MNQSENTDISLDFLAESLNLGLGHVIDELSEISESRIELHVPEINLIPKTEALGFTKELRAESKAIFVKQQFAGDIEGEALLFFSEDESLKLLNGLLPDSDATLTNFADVEEEMLLDITNVAVTGVIYALSSILELSIATELPKCEYGRFDEIEGQSNLFDDAEEMILFITISFTLVSKDAKAVLLFFQHKNSFSKLHKSILQKLKLQ